MIFSDETLVIIPARGGSKGIPKKNLRCVGGVSLLARSIAAAHGAGLRWVVVSTDNDEIAREALRYAASVIDLPDRLAQDHSPADDAVKWTIEQIGPDRVERVVMLQCTSPLTTGEDIGAALHKARHYDSLFSAYPLYPYLWTPEGQPLYDPSRRRRRQDKDPFWLENGAIYIFEPWVLLATGSRLGGNIGVYEMDSWLEIDRPEDLELAEWMLERRQGSAPNQYDLAAKFSLPETAEARHRRPTSQPN